MNLTSVDGLRGILSLQSGVVSRSQLVEGGLAPHDIRRLLRRRELVQMFPGVYLDHTGEPTWKQRAWGAVLAVGPAALSHGSALPPSRSRRDARDVLDVAVDSERSLAAPPGVRLHRLAHLEDKVLWTASPPRVRLEEAAVDVAAEADDPLTAIATLADVVQAGHTTAHRIRVALAGRSRIARRSFLDGVLQDVGSGTCSVLEHEYLTHVERPHGLPDAARQLRDSSRGPVYRDVVYADWDTYVELDGRLFHDTARARDRDLDRDLDAAVDGATTIRLGWGQVFGRPCRTAFRLGLILRRRGWPGSTILCPSCDAS